MNNKSNKEKFINFYNKTIKLFHIIFAIMLILNTIYKGTFSWIFRTCFISVISLDIIYFSLKKRLLESILFSIFLIFILISYIAPIILK